MWERFGNVSAQVTVSRLFTLHTCWCFSVFDFVSRSVDDVDRVDGEIDAGIVVITHHYDVHPAQYLDIYITATKILSNKVDWELGKLCILIGLGTAMLG